MVSSSHNPRCRRQDWAVPGPKESLNHKPCREPHLPNPLSHRSVSPPITASVRSPRFTASGQGPRSEVPPQRNRQPSDTVNSRHHYDGRAMPGRQSERSSGETTATYCRVAIMDRNTASIEDWINHILRYKIVFMPDYLKRRERPRGMERRRFTARKP